MQKAGLIRLLNLLMHFHGVSKNLADYLINHVGRLTVNTGDELVDALRAGGISLTIFRQGRKVALLKPGAQQRIFPLLHLNFKLHLSVAGRVITCSICISCCRICRLCASEAEFSIRPCRPIKSVAKSKIAASTPGRAPILNLDNFI